MPHKFLRKKSNKEWLRMPKLEKLSCNKLARRERISCKRWRWIARRMKNFPILNRWLYYLSSLFTFTIRLNFVVCIHVDTREWVKYCACCMYASMMYIAHKSTTGVHVCNAHSRELCIHTRQQVKYMHICNVHITYKKYMHLYTRLKCSYIQEYKWTTLYVCKSELCILHVHTVQENKWSPCMLIQE